MKKLKRIPVQKLVLLIEAVLIIIGLFAGGDIRICMGCYWTLIAVYHLTEMLDEMRKGEADAGKQDH